MGSKTYKVQYFFINKSRGVCGGEAWRVFSLSKKFRLWYTNWTLVGLYVEYFRLVIMMTFFANFLRVFNNFSRATFQCPLKKTFALRF